MLWEIWMEGLEGPRVLEGASASFAAASAEEFWPNNPIYRMDRGAELSDGVESPKPCGCGGVGSKRCAEEIAALVETQAGVVAGPKTAARFVRELAPV